MKTRHLKGFTIVELLVVISIIALLVGILLPAIGKARDAALTTQSSAHMRNMSTAHAAYSADWADRQWTAVPDDAGYFCVKTGAANWYAAYTSALAGNGGCPPQMVFGWDASVNPQIWGYFLPCSTGSAGGNWVAYQPNTFTPGNVFGSFRMHNVESFNNYINGRFYDPVFYSPKDSLVLSGAEKYFALPDEFAVIPPDDTTDPGIFYTSYIGSPAAMWSPEVLGKNQTTNVYYTDPIKLPAGFKSPPAGAATYPDLKTRMIEHHWLQNKPNSDVNYFIAGGYTPWFFNHGYTSAPICMFFDGHVRVVGSGDAMDADCRSSTGLWSRNTPLGGSGKCVANGAQNGYYQSQSYDFITNTSHTILTIDGIQGRDVLGVK